MPPLSPAAFRERLAALSPAERAAFVAALWRARGRSATADGRRVRVGEGSRSRSLHVGSDAPSEPVDADIDAVVVDPQDGDGPATGGVGDTGGVDVVDADDLRDLLLYGVDPDAGNRLGREHLGVPIRSTQYARRTAGDVDGSNRTARADETGGGEGVGGAAETAGATGADATGRTDEASEASGTDGAAGATDGGGSGARVGSGGDGDGRGGDARRAGALLDRDGAGQPTRRVGAVALLVAALALAAALGGSGVGLPLGALGGAGAPGDAGAAEGAGSETVGAGTANGSETVEPYTEPRADGPAPDGGPEEEAESDSGAGAGGTPDGEGSAPDGVSGENVTADDEARLAGDASQDVLPPGVGLDGDVDASALAAAHGRLLANRSYTLVVTHREFRDGRPVALRQEVARVVDDREYVSSVTRIGGTTAPVRTVADVERYANGNVRATRPVGGDDDGDGGGVGGESARLARTGPEDPFRERSVRYVRWFASVRNSTVVEATERDGRVRYWLSLADDPWPGVANSTGSLLVDERGLVHSIRRSYDVPDRPTVSVVVTIEVTNVGETTAPPPAWYPFEDEVGGSGGGTPSAPATDGPAESNGTNATDTSNATDLTGTTNATAVGGGPSHRSA